MKIDRNLILLSAISFSIGITVAFVKSFFSIYLDEIGIALFSIGLIYAAGAVAAGILRFPLAGLINKYGSKSLMFVGAVGYPLFAYGVTIASTTEHFIGLKILFEVLGAVFWTAFWVYLYDTLVKGEEGRGITLTGVFRKLPYLAGPFIAGLVISAYGFENLFYLAAIAGTLSIFVVALAKPLPKRKTSLKQLEKEYSTLLHTSRIRAMIFVAVMHEMIWIAWMVYMPIYLKDIGYSEAMIGILLSISMLIIILIELPVGKAIDIFHSKYILVPGFFLMWISGYAFLLTTKYLNLVISRAAVRAGNFLNWEPLLARLSEATPNKKHGFAVAAFRGSLHITSGVFALVWGYVASIYGIKFVLFTVSSIAFAGGFIAMFLRRKVKQKGQGIWRRHHYAHLHINQGHK